MKIILKADDLAGYPGKNKIIPKRWQRFVDLIEKYKIKATIGIIGNSLLFNDEGYFEWVKKYDKLAFIEFWNHGFLHRQFLFDNENYQEFKETTIEYQLQLIEYTNKLAKEKLNIEFKREWYWNKRKEEKNQVSWDEFLKDFSALFNIIDENKYFIIGMSDDGKNFYNYFEDNEKNKLKFFDNDIEKVKSNIVDKILNYFDCFYFDNEPLQNEKEILKKIIIFDIFNKDEKEILIIKIEQSPFLLKLKRERNLKKFRETSIIIRTYKEDGPGCTILDLSDEIYKKKFDKFYNKYKILSSKNTIIDVIEAYAKFLYNRYNIKKHNVSTTYSSSEFFEIYSIIQNDKYLEVFIYFSKYSSIQKILKNYIIKEYGDILKKHQEIYIIFEEQRDFKRIISRIGYNHIKSENQKITILSKNVKYFDSPIQFIEKEIYFQVKNDIKNELFPKRFSGVFVNPLINSSDIDIISKMKQWIDAKHLPIFALIGSGGVGKTTIAKKFCSQVENDVIFIDSKDLISNIRYIAKLNTIYDFVKLFIKSQSDIEIDENYFSEEMINVLVDSGKLLIVIDGLDEVILNYSDFDFNNFIKTIYNNCLDNLGKTKILLTIRDTFWKEEYEKNIENSIIKGFDIAKSEEYFEKKLEDDKLVNKALKLLKTNLKDDLVSPFILEIISLAIKKKISNENINSNYICNDIFIDNLIYHICNREIIKFESSHSKNIDEQIKFFIKMSIEYNGEITLKQLFSILDENMARAYKAHALLSLEGDILSFKFDLLIEYFKILSVTKIINKNINDYQQDDLLQEKNNTLFKQIYLNDQNLKRINNNIEELKFLYIQIIDRLENIEFLKKHKYIFSFILSILLRLNPKKDKQSNTEFIKEILNKNDKYVGLCLSDNYLHDKFLFSFEDITFECCYIDYKYFGDCNFNKSTIFYNSIIQGYYNVKYNFSENNFDTSSILSEDMKKILEVREEDIKDERDKIKNDILEILRKFYKHSFKVIKKERLKNINNNIFDFLKKEKIIINEYQTTSSKRREEMFMINKNFQNELELIFGNQIVDIKLLDELIDKYLKK
jgi:hypothetical protein